MNNVCREIRAHILNVSQSSGHGHIPTSFSIIEAVYAAYAVMRHDPLRPDWPERDLFILSKGHASLGYYSVLAALDYFPPEDVFTFGKFESSYGCHPDRLKVPGIEASTGSLGHGIGLAVGMALSAKIRKEDRKIFTLIGDGESNEGSVWEAVMVAANLGLSNLTIIYDLNMSQGRCLPVLNPADRFQAFNCDVIEVDGHDIEALKQAYRTPVDRVKVVVAHSIKGYGCRTLVDNMYEWHRRSPSKEQLPQLLEELHAWAV
jgi:transketolase